MRHRVMLGTSMALALTLAACGGGDRAAEQSGGDAQTTDTTLLNSDTRLEPVTASGCLTGSNGRYVVTALNSAGAVPTTVTYQLSGGNDAELQKHVNREVRIAGEANPAQVADVRDVGTPAVGTSGERVAGAGETPKAEVKTQQAMRFEVRTLTVTSVTPTGDECPADPARTN